MEERHLSFYLNEFVVWAEEKGYVVHFEENGDNCICSQSKIIEINSSAPLRHQVYCLLHECGHALIFDNGSFWDYDKKRGPSLERDLSPHECKNVNRVYTVIEEVEAWKRGLKLAKRLRIPISKDEWEAEMLDAIGKYIDWAATSS